MFLSFTVLFPLDQILKNDFLICRRKDGGESSSFFVLLKDNMALRCGVLYVLMGDGSKESHSIDVGSLVCGVEI